MANVNRPSGFKPVKYLNGSPWNGKFNMYYASDASAIYKGDAVYSASSADATGKYPSVSVYASGGGNVRGVAIGFSTTPQLAADVSNLARAYRPASVSMYIAVVDDPDVIFEVQEDNADNDLAITEVGLNTDIALTHSGSTTTGVSGMELDSSGTGTTTAQCRILRLVNREDNALGTYAKWEVIFNEHELKSTTGN